MRPDRARAIDHHRPFAGGSTPAPPLVLYLSAPRGFGPRVPRTAAGRAHCSPWSTCTLRAGAASLIALCGGRNAFAAGWAGEDAAAGKAEKRYPKLSLDDVVAAAPDVVLLPDEPYVFGEADREELLALPIPAARSGRIHLVAGSLLTWYGPQVKCAIDTIRPLCAPTSDS